MKNMKNKPVVLLGAAVCLLPCLFGLILYKDLPDRLPIHWNMAGEADNFAPKPFAVFGLPVILALFHLICHIGASADKRRANYSKALEAMTYWFIPALSLILCPMTLLASKGVDVRIEVIVPCLYRTYARLYRKLSSQMQAQQHHGYQNSVDTEKRRELEQNAPPCRQALDRRRNCQHYLHVLRFPSIAVRCGCSRGRRARDLFIRSQPVASRHQCRDRRCLIES